MLCDDFSDADKIQTGQTRINVLPRHDVMIGDCGVPQWATIGTPQAAMTRFCPAAAFPFFFCRPPALFFTRGRFHGTEVFLQQLPVRFTRLTLPFPPNAADGDAAMPGLFII